MSDHSQIVWDGINNRTDKALSTFYRDPCTQLKYDGSMYHLHIKDGRPIAFTSKRVSVKTNRLNDKLDHFPNLHDGAYPLSDAVFVGEVVIDHLKALIDKGTLMFKDKPVSWNKRCNVVAGFMNSVYTKENYNELYKALPMFRYLIFDVMRLGGRDVSFLPYRDRLTMIRDYFPEAGVFGENMARTYHPRQLEGSPCFAVSNFSNKNISPKGIFDQVVSQGFEGVVVKDLNGSNSIKLKREKTADCAIVGYTPGAGKYDEMVGSLILGVFDPEDVKNAKTPDDLRRLVKKNRFTVVGNASGFPDEQRADFTDNMDAYLGSLVECTYMEWTGKAMRHPRFTRFRDDKQISRVTLKQFED